MNQNTQEKSDILPPLMSIHTDTETLIETVLQKYSIILDTRDFPAGVYTASLLYMVYWFQRIRDPEKKEQIRDYVRKYLIAGDHSPIADEILNNQVLIAQAKEYMKNGISVRKTVDVLVTRQGSKGKEFLALERSFFPEGLSLPGGLIRDEDDHNEYDIPGNIFATLRVTGEKIFISTELNYGRAETEGRKYYFVRTDTGNEARIYMDATISQSYKDHLGEITFPSDPRHMVDTVGYLVEVADTASILGKWLPEEAISDPHHAQGTFAFGHHKQIAASLLAKNFSHVEGVSHHEWIRGTVKDPVCVYTDLRQRFHENGNDRNTSVPELFPVVDYIRNTIGSSLYDDRCRQNPALGLMRTQLIHKLHHVTIRNAVICPYESTLRVIFEAAGFFDVVNRSLKDFSTHFQKKYWYRFERLMDRIPDVILIPTFDNISATDLMRIRGVPLYFIGVSPDPVYVDEFWQSPLEFLIHDLNHAWKMMDADRRFLEMHPGLTKEAFMKDSSKFIQEYLPSIAIQKTDTEEEREMKKLKKILLFEVGHEDARPLLADIVAGALLEAEGYEIPDELVRYSDNGKETYIERRTIRGITALSYVRHKLQHGFFDQTDAQNIQIVGPRYRTVEWIVRAAQSLLSDIGTIIPEYIQKEGLTAYLTRQACSRGPAILHARENLDPAILDHGDGTIDESDLSVTIS